MINRLELIQGTDIVFASWSGLIDREKRHQLRKEILKHCNLHNSKKFIVDLRKQEHIVNVKESYEFGRTFRREMQGFLLAAIVESGSQTEWIISETINRGEVEMEEFNSFEQAFEWISKID